MNSKSPTKQSILHHSIRMFADQGYESVSMRNIAAAVGIRAASIYNHYESKETLLADAYNYFLTHADLNRLTLEECEPVLRSGNATEIMSLFNYPLAEPVEIVFASVRLVWARRYVDEAAKRLFNESVIDGAMAYMHQVLNRGVEIGRIRMTPDEIRHFSTAMLALRVYTASAVVTDPNQTKWRDVENETTAYLCRLLTLTED